MAGILFTDVPFTTLAVHAFSIHERVDPMAYIVDAIKNPGIAVLRYLP
jgi:hypothetical protein